MVHHGTLMRMRGAQLLSQLDDLKGQFGPQAAERAAELLGKIAQEKYREPGDLIHLHETILFLRAYPQSEVVRRLADDILFHFANRLPPDHSAFDDPEVSGIDGTEISTSFSYEFVDSLLARHRGAV